VKGLITTRWEKIGDGRLSLSVTVPPNTRACIYVPRLSTDGVTLMESGKRLWPASKSKIPGVLAVQEQDSHIKCQIAAGKYRFVEQLAH
jgi:hypothetical protein